MTRRRSFLSATYIAELAQLLHAEAIAMFAAYCDESYGPANAYYVVAGFCTRTERWSYFEDLWRSSMRELDIEEFGLHASKCANGAKPYSGMAPAARDDIQHRMIVDIAASRPIMGFVAAIDLPAFAKHRAEMIEDVGPAQAKYVVPHVFAMELCVELITLILEDVAKERIAFFFDRNGEFGGRAHEWYAMSVRRPLGTHHLKLGPFKQDSRQNALGLQAADLLAYSAFRNFVEPQRERWQWRELNQAASRIVTFVADESFWTATSALKNNIADNIRSAGDASGE